MPSEVQISLKITVWESSWQHLGDEWPDSGCLGFSTSCPPALAHAQSRHCRCWLKADFGKLFPFFEMILEHPCSFLIFNVVHRIIWWSCNFFWFIVFPWSYRLFTNFDFNNDYAEPCVICRSDPNHYFWNLAMQDLLERLWVFSGAYGCCTGKSTLLWSTVPSWWWSRTHREHHSKPPHHTIWLKTGSVGSMARVVHGYR